MAKRVADPVLQQLVHAIDESGHASVPVTLGLHGMMLSGELIAERRYLTDLAERNPLLSALEPSSGLLGKDYTKAVDDESGHYLHVRAGDDLWRISLRAVDGWTLRTVAATDGEDNRGPFARLLAS